MLKLKGFTLLEAIVALVLIATAGVGLLNWINSNFVILQRVKASQQRQEAVRNALIFMESVNPLEEPQGEKTVGVQQYRWQSHTINPPKSGLQANGAFSIFEVGLYDTEMQVRVENQVIARFTVRQVGFRQVFIDTSEDN